jgi:hypothetical protein
MSKSPRFMSMHDASAATYHQKPRLPSITCPEDIGILVPTSRFVFVAPLLRELDLLRPTDVQRLASRSLVRSVTSTDATNATLKGPFKRSRKPVDANCNDRLVCHPKSGLWRDVLAANAIGRPGLI